MKPLLKYNFQEMLIKMLPFYAVLLAVSLMRLVAVLLTNTADLFKTIEILFGLLFTVVAVIVIVWAQFVSVVQFYKKITKDEGYLVNMLPVKQSSIVLSYVISAFVIVVLSVAVIGVCLFVTIEPRFYAGFLNGVKILFTQILNGSIVFFVIFNILVDFIGNLMIYYLAIMLGQTRNRNRLLYMVAFGLIISIGVSLLAFIPLIIVTLINPLVGFTGSIPMMVVGGYISSALCASVIFNIIIIVLCYLATVWLMKNKLNLQ